MMPLLHSTQWQKVAEEHLQCLRKTSCDKTAIDHQIIDHVVRQEKFKTCNV